jgi:NAD(P)-dependent dehydrogenase (short-subunit alcohol dehydrogenase family)
MVGQFTGKVALVTGGASGFGRTVAQGFAHDGAKVVVADVNVEGGKETVQLIKSASGEATFVRTDVTKAAEVEALVSKTVEAYGRLDCAFNNAGILGTKALFHELTEENWDRVIDTNLKSVFLCMKYELAYMMNHGGGSIVNTSSVAGLVATGGPDVPYTTSKHGVLGLTKSAGIGYARHGIRVNAVCPGPADTPLYRNQVLGGDQQTLQDNASRMPLGRLITTDEVASAVLWLCSDAASYINAVALPVDGGLTSRWGISSYA